MYCMCIRLEPSGRVRFLLVSQRMVGLRYFILDVSVCNPTHAVTLVTVTVTVTVTVAVAVVAVTVTVVIVVIEVVLH